MFNQVPDPFAPPNFQKAARGTLVCSCSVEAWLILAVVALAVVSGGTRGYASSRPQAKALDEMNQGIALYRSSDFPGAVGMLQKASADDPKLVKGWLFLGLAYTQEYVPGGDSAENKQLGRDAIAALEEAAKIDPGNKLALAGIGSMYYSLRDLEKAKEWERKREEVETGSPEPFYWVGVIDWYEGYRNTRYVRENLGGSSDPPAPLPENARAGLARQNGPLIAEGTEALRRALELFPNYVDAMVYVNLLYRQKAELEQDGGARAADLKIADEWVDKALAARRSGAPTGFTAQGEQDTLFPSPPHPPPPSH